MLKPFRIGLIGYGKAGKAVANVFSSNPRFELCWIVRLSASDDPQIRRASSIPIFGLERHLFSDLFKNTSVDAPVDFSSRESLRAYDEKVSRHSIALDSAILPARKTILYIGDAIWSGLYLARMSFLLAYGTVVYRQYILGRLNRVIQGESRDE